MKAGKEQSAERQQRAAEYAKMRAALLEIVDSMTATDRDRIEAIKTICKMDAEGMPNA